MIPTMSERQFPARLLCILFSAAILSPACSHADNHSLDEKSSAALDAAIAGSHRSDGNRARDQYRRPKETLAFFGFRSDMTVVEISPRGGWYTEVLAPALRNGGTLYAAHSDVNGSSYGRRSLGGFLRKLGENGDVYDQVVVSSSPIAPANTADLVVTFRNVHNWLDPESDATSQFAEMYAALKPGGVLGVVDHRWPDAATEDPAAGNGYVSEERVIRLVEAAGFEFEARSDHNRNPKDTHDHPNGVWTLLPGLDIDDAQKDKFRAIGESDRMVLRFRKPAD